MTVTNSCALPLRVFAKPSEVEEEVGTGAIRSASEGASTGEDGKAQTNSKPTSFLVDLPKGGVTLEPNESYQLCVHYAPISTPVLIQSGQPILKGITNLFSEGILDLSSLRSDLPVSDELSELPSFEDAPDRDSTVVSQKMKARARTMARASTNKLSTMRQEEESNEGEGYAGISMFEGTTFDPDTLAALNEEVGKIHSAPSHHRHNSIAPRLPSPSNTRLLSQTGFSSPTSASAASSSLLPSQQVLPPGASWEFPIDRLTIPLYAEGRDTMMTAIKCVGKGGLMSLTFSHHNIEFSRVPRGATRRDEIIVGNRGDVPVVIHLSALDSDVPSTMVDTRAGRLQIRAETIDAGGSPSSLSLSPGEDRIILVEFDVTGVGGEFRIPFRVNLYGTTARKCWHFGVTGFVDDIRLSQTMEAFIKAEALESVQPMELTRDDQHLREVLAPVDYVPTVSVHHQLASVEPYLALSTLSSSLALPPALAPSVLMTFKRWYFDRIPLRMTVQTDKFHQLESMLADKTVQYQEQ